MLQHVRERMDSSLEMNSLTQVIYQRGLAFTYLNFKNLELLSEVVSVPQLLFGDCLDRLKELLTDSVDAIVTDPPYGMEFMGKEWDSFRTKDGFRRRDNANDAGRDNAFGRLSQKGPEYYAGAFQGYMTPIFAECLRVLKPGGHLLAFGGSRTYHR